MNYSIANISTIINAKLLQPQEDVLISYLLTDSRKLLFPSETLFFALATRHRNANVFVPELYKQGVRGFVVDKGFENAGSFPAAAFLLVENVLDALQALAAHHRGSFKIPVIGITGSNGKTIVKEWLYQLLQQGNNIVRSPKSYNSQVGVPLSVWQIDETHTLGIFEAGISLPGEMEKLEKIIRPTIGVFTNIGEAHSEGFEGAAQKLEEKLNLFRHASVMIYNKDMVDAGLLSKNITHFDWSKAGEATLRISHIEKREDHTVISAEYQTNDISIGIPFSDDASIENAINCWCVLLHLGLGNELIAENMPRLQPVEMRLQLKAGINNCSVINDSYSADINSLSIALDFLLQQQQHEKRTVILSDIIGSGKDNAELYRTIAGILRQKKVNRVIAIGPNISAEQKAFDGITEKLFFETTAAFLKDFYTLHFSNETVLVKGARFFEFERISRLLEQKLHQTFLEINLTAIANNLAVYRRLLNPGVKLMAMVKASGYGSGSFEIANLLQFNKVECLAVAYADEGVELRKAGIRLPIMVMNAEETSFESLVQYDLEPELYSFDIAANFQTCLGRLGMKHYPVHIKLDTGMHRLGFEAKDIDQLAAQLRANDHFKIRSVFSHLAASDAAEHDGFTRQQATIFLTGCEKLEHALGYPFLRHIANTSAISRHPDLQLDMVRLGIGLYGVDSNAAVQHQLSNVATLKTTISQIKKVSAGDTVGYSRKGILTKDSLVATVRIGYADGYPRSLSNGVGSMLVNGRQAPVVGNVCMDMTMLDITGIPAAEGDEVIVFGKGQPVSLVAAQASTISYEILTGISQRVQRVYYEE